MVKSWVDVSATAQRGAEDIELELKTEGVDLSQLHDLAAPAIFLSMVQST